MYVRKTKDEWGIYGYYYGEWSLETCADNRKDAKRLLKEYQDNCPETSFRIICRRVKLSDQEYEELKKEKNNSSCRS